MSANIEQVFLSNPATTLQTTDLFYLGRSPYGAGNDMAAPFSVIQGYFLQPSNNLSDVTNKPVALSNLGAVPLAGGTMTGALILNTSSPSTALQAASKGYVDSQVGGSVTLTGDVTGTGTGTVPTTISNGVVTFAKMANLAATSLIGNATGGSATPTAISFNTFLQSANNLSDLASATTARTNLGLGTAATKDSTANYPTVASVIGVINTSEVAIFADDDGTVTSSGILFTDLLVSTANLSDVASASTSLSNLNGVSRAGSTMTGLLVLSGDPVSALGAATKQYVDNKSVQLPLVQLSAGTHTMVVNTRYLVDSTAGQVILNLPATFAIGDAIFVYGTGNIAGGGWAIACGVSQRITGGGVSTPTGGAVVSTAVSDCLELLGIVANGTMKMINGQAKILNTA